jgi:hypothetical protein
MILNISLLTLRLARWGLYNRKSRISITCIGSLHMRQIGELPLSKIVKQRLTDSHLYSCDTPLPPESGYAIHVQNEILNK